jgi:hypothetical protein
MKKHSKTNRDAPGTSDDRSSGSSHLHVRPKPNTMFGPPPLIVENVFFSKVGHTFGPASSFSGKGYVVQDFLLDQTGASGADGKMKGTTLFDLTTAIHFRFNIYPRDRAKVIKVVPPANTQVFMGLDVGRRYVNAMSDVSDIYPAFSFFANVSGSLPVFTYNYFFIGRNTNHWVHFNVSADLTTPLSFSGFTTIGNYPPRAFDPGPKTYIPFSTALPFNLPGPNAVPFLMFGYQTPNSTDPGPFVFLE